MVCSPKRKAFGRQEWRDQNSGELQEAIKDDCEESKNEEITGRVNSLPCSALRTREGLCSSPFLMGKYIVPGR